MFGRYLRNGGQAVVDPSTLPGFQAMFVQGDYVLGVNGVWTRHTPLPVVTNFSNPAAFAPADTNAEPVFSGAATVSLQGAALNSLITNQSWTVFAGFITTTNQAPAAAAYDDPQVMTTGGGYFGLGYSNRFEAWYYTGSTPSINLALGASTWAIGQSRYNVANAAASRFQARLNKNSWTSFGSDPGAIQNMNQAAIVGNNYAFAQAFAGTVRFLLFYTLPLSDADADSVCDWAHATWPSSF